MLPLRNNHRVKRMPLLTYTIIALNIFIYLWDRNWHPFAPSIFFGGLQMRPVDISHVFSGGDRMALVTLITSMFLHGNIAHLIGNLLYLLTFGEAIEYALGSWRLLIYYLFWGLIAAGTQVFVNPQATNPVLGASGAIGGVLGAYFLLYPASRIELFLYVTTLVVDAWILLGLWFLYQILVPVEGVANWAHAGGFVAGMATVLIMGGRKKVLEGKEEDYGEDDDDDE